MSEDPELVRLRLARGCRAFLARLDGEVTGYGWVSTGPEWMGELSLEITVPAGGAYIWNCLTLLPHRRKGTFRALLAAIMARLRAEGVGRLWIGSLEGTAEQAVADAGFKAALKFEVTLVGDHKHLQVAVSGLPGQEALKALQISEGLVKRPATRRRH